MATNSSPFTVAALIVCCTVLATPTIAQPADSWQALRVNYDTTRKAGDDADAGVAPAAQVVADWIAGPGNAQLEDLREKQLGWLLKSITWSRKKFEGGFSVTWTGQIRPLQSGSYTFSVSPIDINRNFLNEVVSQWMTVRIDGQEVVNASPGDWKYEGEAVELSAGVSVPLQVTYRYETTSRNIEGGKPPCAVLYWEGPGISKTVVPANVLLTPDGKANGLLAEYKRPSAEGDEVLTTLVEPRLEHLWQRDRNFISPHPDAQQQVTSELWGRLINPALFDTCEAANDPLQHRLIRDSKLGCYLTGEQRREFLERLTERPALLEMMSIDQISEVFVNCQQGTGNASVRLLGTWMHLHSNVEPELALNFYRENRHLYRYLTIRLVWQDRRGIELLLDEYLELPDGSCCLPAAYTLAYGHLVQGKIEEWVELLNAKLADNSLTGERRVNWLLARAQAQEIRHGLASRHVIRWEALLAGREWLEEAQLVAESQAASRRALKERASRLTATNQWEPAKQLLQQHAAGSISQEELTTWQMDIDAMELAAEELQEKNKVDARIAQLDELRRRKQRATDAGNAAAEARYSNLIEQMNQNATR